MYRFALRPWWIVSHLFVLALVVAMINLGFWQLRRLDERQATNERIEARSEGEPVRLESIVDPDDPTAVGSDLEWENVTLTGEYLVDEQVLVRSRSQGGQPGFWLVTPLLTGADEAVAVIRGWIPFRDETDGSDIEVETPAGPVLVTGYLQRSFGPATPGGDEQVTVAHLDLDWLDDQTDLDVYPVAVRLVEQAPGQVEHLPVVLDPPDRGDGPHQGYAVQWFIFSTIAIVGYPIILRRVARQKAAARAEDEAHEAYTASDNQPVDA